jgi:hypothetical protein
MSKPLSESARVIILVIAAVLFAATMIALSLHYKDTIPTDRTHIIGDDKKIEQQYFVQPGGKLQIDTEVGSVSIIGTERNEVLITVYARGEQVELDKLDIKMNQDGNTIAIDGRYSRGHFRWFNTEWLDVLFEIEVPKKFNIDLRTAGGNIEIESVEGSIGGETSGGNLTLEDLTGEVRLTTSGGNVDIRRASGDFRCIWKPRGGILISGNVTGICMLQPPEEISGLL